LNSGEAKAVRKGSSNLGVTHGLLGISGPNNAMSCGTAVIDPKFQSGGSQLIDGF
jgi:hypothetical protein